MKSKLNPILSSPYLSFGAAIVFSASIAQGQNLFESDDFSGNVYEFTPGGSMTTFASGLSAPLGLAFNRAGDLFVAVAGGNIYEFTPSGVPSTFASALSAPEGLSFNDMGDLFASDFGSGNIYEFTPGGVKSTFASGLSLPVGLAFNSAGDLFEADHSGNIYEFTPGGVRSTFAFAFGFHPLALAFNSAGDLFESDGSDYIYEFTPGGVPSIFASGLSRPIGLAFQGGTLPIPEPSTLGLLAVGITMLFVRRHKHRRPNNSPEPPPNDATSPHSRLADAAVRLSFCR